MKERILVELEVENFVGRFADAMFSVALKSELEKQNEIAGWKLALNEFIQQQKEERKLMDDIRIFKAAREKEGMLYKYRNVLEYHKDYKSKKDEY